MKTVFLIILIIVACILIALILLQNSSGGLRSGLGGMEFYRSKRGAERIVFIATIVCSFLFFISSILNVLIH
jgi:protein translocase SecG subunit